MFVRGSLLRKPVSIQAVGPHGDPWMAYGKSHPQKPALAARGVAQPMSLSALFVLVKMGGFGGRDPDG